jgi:hypothetical protein
MVRRTASIVTHFVIMPSFIFSVLASLIINPSRFKHRDEHEPSLTHPYSEPCGLHFDYSSAPAEFHHHLLPLHLASAPVRLPLRRNVTSPPQLSKHIQHDRPYRTATPPLQHHHLSSHPHSAAMSQHQLLPLKSPLPPRARIPSTGTAFSSCEPPVVATLSSPPSSAPLPQQALQSPH